MKFEQWLSSVPQEITDDTLWRMEVPAERGYKLEEEPVIYSSTAAELLNNPPMPS